LEEFNFIFFFEFLKEGRSIAFKYGCKFVETSVAINDKVDDLLAGILKQIRLYHAANNRGDDGGSFALQQQQKPDSNTMSKKLKRNNSDAFINEIIKKTSSSGGGGGHNTISFKANTLTRRLFKSSTKKNVESGIGATASASSFGASSSSQVKNKTSTGGSATPSSFSFVKFFHSLFKKKSNRSHIQSVENLFTSPVVYISTAATQAKLKK